MAGWTVECSTGRRGAPIVELWQDADGCRRLLDSLAPLCGPHKLVRAVWAGRASDDTAPQIGRRRRQ